jgi:small neutral amino acid transporter SnatA (MarC family)
VSGLVLGLALTAAVTAILVLGWGTEALLPGLVFGLIATAIQAISVALVRPVFSGETVRLLKRWGIGMLLRVLGVALVALAVSLDRALFPPLPTALAFLGVLVPLLFLEVRLVR